MVCVFFFKQKTAYEIRISDCSSDVCSSDLTTTFPEGLRSSEFIGKGRLVALRVTFSPNDAAREISKSITFWSGKLTNGFWSLSVVWIFAVAIVISVLRKQLRAAADIL